MNTAQRHATPDWPARWSPRRALLFILGTDTLLWAALILLARLVWRLSAAR